MFEAQRSLGWALLLALGCGGGKGGNADASGADGTTTTATDSATGSATAPATDPTSPTDATDPTDPTDTTDPTDPTDGPDDGERTVVSDAYPLALTNTRSEPVVWPLWGGSFTAADAVRVRVDFTAASGGAGLLFAGPGKEQPSPRALALRHADGGWTLEDRGGTTKAPVPVAAEANAVVELAFDPSGAAVEVSSGGEPQRIVLDPPLLGAGQTLGTYVEIDPDAELEIAALSLDEPYPSSERLGPSLRELAAKRGVTIGSATDVWPPIHDLSFEQLLGQQFDVAAPSEFYWTTTRAEEGRFFFVPADTMVNYGLVHDQRLRGYHLVWDFELPQWLIDIADIGDADALATALRDHVQTIVGRYSGRVQEWVVVNEAIWGPEALPGPQEEAEYAADSPWFQVLGAEYIEMSFLAAREADPDAVLLYNETGAEGIGAKSDFMYDMVADFVQRDIPIDGVGLQFHVDAVAPPDPTDLVANMQRFADLGLDIYITELDVDVGGLEGSEAEQLEAQAAVYTTVVQACLDVAACRSITLWGFTDRYAWYEEGAVAPLVFDADYAPKPAFFAIQNALQSQ